MSLLNGVFAMKFPYKEDKLLVVTVVLYLEM